MELLWSMLPAQLLECLAACHEGTRAELAWRAQLARLVAGATHVRRPPAASSTGGGGIFGGLVRSVTGAPKQQEVHVAVIDFKTGFYSIQWRAQGGAAADCGDIKASAVGAVVARGEKSWALLPLSMSAGGQGGGGGMGDDGRGEGAPPPLLELDAPYAEQRDEWVAALAELLARVHASTRAGESESDAARLSSDPSSTSGAAAGGAGAAGADGDDSSLVGVVRAKAAEKERWARRQIEMRERDAERKARKAKLGLDGVGMKYTAIAMASSR